MNIFTFNVPYSQTERLTLVCDYSGVIVYEKGIIRSGKGISAVFFISFFIIIFINSFQVIWFYVTYTFLTVNPVILLTLIFHLFQSSFSFSLYSYQLYRFTIDSHFCFTLLQAILFLFSDVNSGAGVMGGLESRRDIPRYTRGELYNLLSTTYNLLSMIITLIMLTFA